MDILLLILRAVFVSVLVVAGLAKLLDPRAARQAMRDHLERVIDHLLHATETEAVQKAQQETKARRNAIAKRVAI